MRNRLTTGYAAAVAVLAGSFACADVLIAGELGDFTWLDDVRQKIDATGILAGHTIDMFNIGTGTPTPELLAGYDAVLSFTLTAPNDPTLWGDLLADYVDSGGGLLQMTFSWEIGPAGRLFTGGYSPLLVAGTTSGVQMGLGTKHCPNHPIMLNVNSFDGGTSSFHNTGGYAPGAIAIADWSDGLPFAAEMPGFAARIVALNFWPVSSDRRGDFWDATTDGDILMANALAYVMTAPGPIPSTVSGFNTTKGQQSGGDVDSLRTSDDNSLEIDAVQTGTRHRTKTLVNLQVAATDVTQLDLRIETGVNAGNVTTRVQLYDFDAGRWRLIKKLNQSRNDRSRLWQMTSNPGRFIKTSGLVKVRISSVRKGGAYTLRTDHVEVLIKPVTQ